MAVRLGAICAVLLALLPASPPPARADALADVFERVALSVVVVRTSERDIANEGTQRTVIISWFGSGVLIAPDWKTASKISAELVGGVRMDAHVMASEPDSDVTHSADPFRVAGAGEPVYGCTEFVFALEPDGIQAGRVELVVKHIERWLEWAPEDRMCAPGNRQLFLRP